MNIKILQYPPYNLFRFLIFSFIFLNACETTKTGRQTYYPEEDLGNFFHEVQMNHVFQDSKTFVDCTPMMPPNQIVKEYRNQKDKPGFDLATFVLARFKLPDVKNISYATDKSKSMEEHITSHWTYLTRSPDSVSSQSTLIPLPNSYVVPGGRFREVYYWDSFFTILGLAASDRMDLVKNMIDNFAFLTDQLEFIPNGNRTYYRGRSQPPFFSSMVMHLAEIEGEEKAVAYLNHLEKEYEFWMDGSEGLTTENPAQNRVVMVEPGVLLNRYWDNYAEPRPESYVEDYKLAQGFPPGERPDVYRNLRAAAESGWDFSSRWFTDGESLDSIATIDILPVDLNCLLYHLEGSIALLNGHLGNMVISEDFQQKAWKRKNAINKYFWNNEEGFFFDYNFRQGKKTNVHSLAGSYPLYFQIAESDQVEKVAEMIREKFLLDGGVVTTLNNTSQQWDYPNGWAPLQWITIRGLMNYGVDTLAEDISDRWLNLNRKVYERTGKMMEKYNVADISLEAGGGEYPLQDGFGWTNGVAIALIRDEVGEK